MEFDLVTHIYKQRSWSTRTFGSGPRTLGILDHINKELKEIEEAPSDLTEWVDVIILALDGAWRAGFTPEEVAKAISNKQEKNEIRKWPSWRDYSQDKAIEHIKNEDNESCKFCLGRGWFSTDMMGSAFYHCEHCNTHETINTVYGSNVKRCAHDNT